jgi:mRNA-degrading endonuclease RelE of RelBE toxin-antitoxin system
VADDVTTAVRRLHPESRRRVRAAVDTLRGDPYRGGELHGELAGLWRYPVGQLRLVYRFDDLTLAVLAVGPRSIIYEDLARRAGRPTAGRDREPDGDR